MSKRGNNAGSVFDAPKGSGRWYAQLPAGPDGKRPKRYAGDGATKEDAERLLRQMHAEREAGRNLARKSETVADLLDYAIETVRAQISPGTVRSYRTRARRITDRIGAMRIRDVSVETVQRLANDLAVTHSPGYIKGALEQLSAAFQLVIPEKIAYNPVNWRKLKLRKPVKVERQPADESHVLAVLAAADDVQARGGDARYGIAWWLAALLGLRRGEIAALSWRDINFDKAEAQIRQSFAPNETGGRFTLGPTKTRRTRVIPIGPRLLARLREQWELHQGDRRRPTWREQGFVLATEAGDPVAQLALLNRDLHKVCAAARIPAITPHQLRHTAATIMDEEAFSETIIAAILGHDKGANITRRYTHARERAKRTAILAIERRYFGDVIDQREVQS